MWFISGLSNLQNDIICQRAKLSIVLWKSKKLHHGANITKMVADGLNYNGLEYNFTDYRCMLASPDSPYGQPALVGSYRV